MSTPSLCYNTIVPREEQKGIDITMEELQLTVTWENWLSRHDSIDEESINDFCNIHANSYEEYMTLYEFLMNLFKEV